MNSTVFCKAESRTESIEKGENESMSELLFFVLGVMLGGLVMLVTLCGMQLHRVRQYEAEIQRLRERK